MSASSTEETEEVEDYSLAYAHGTVMVLAWMVFASTGILFSRYGRFLQIGNKKNFLGEAIWFQTHRFALTLASVATLLGFFLVLAQAGGKWVSVADDGERVFAHSILGVIVICLTMVQVWMALYRCHPDGRFRFIYNWLHRGTGVLAFVLSIPTIYLIITYLEKYRDGLYAVISIWTGWIVLIVIILEFISYRSRKLMRIAAKRNNARSDNTFELQRSHSATPNGLTSVVHVSAERDPFSEIKLVLFAIHLIVVIALVIPFIVLIWKQK